MITSNNPRSKSSNPKSNSQPGQENLEIDYTGLSFIKPEQIRFRYKLEGLDKDWTDAGERRDGLFSVFAARQLYVSRRRRQQRQRLERTKCEHLNRRSSGILSNLVVYYFVCLWRLPRSRFGSIEKGFLKKNENTPQQEEFSRRLIDAHESERRRVAAELHDSLGQTLAMIKNRAVFASQNTNDLEKAKGEFDQITEQSVYAINEVREISYNLRPYLLDRLGLTKALKSLFNKTAENSQLKVTAEIENVDDLFTKEEEMSLYRIVQESLNNVLKHAEAKEVNINISKSENSLFIKIQDDGKGFVTNGLINKKKKVGFGLFGIAERIKILGGKHTIESDLGSGTSVIIKLNISKKNKANNNEKGN